MKTSVSLLIAFLSFLLLNFGCSMSLRSQFRMRTYIMNKVAEGMTFTSKSHSTDDNPNPNLPSFSNRGFKCAKVSVSTTTTDSKTNQSTTTVSSKFILTRLSNSEMQCITDDKKACLLFDDTSKCNSAVSKSSDSNKIMRLEKTYNDAVTQFYFNRWICPDESGLPIAIQFSKKSAESSYTVSCLGKSGKDCYYNDNASYVCKRVNECSKAINNFIPLTCGTDAFKSTWFTDGFNTPLPTWCKKANAWLRFDASFSVSTDKKAFLLNDSGLTNCIPDPQSNKDCLVDNADGILQKSISYIAGDATKFNSLLVCDERLFPVAIASANHWCKQSLLLPDANGKIAITITTS